MSKESQTGSHKKAAVDTQNSILNQTAFTDAREAAMLAQTPNTTSSEKVDLNTNKTQTSSANASDGNVTRSAQEQVISDASSEDDAQRYNDEGSKQPVDSEAPVKKQQRKKPRIIFHPEDECRRSSKPSDDDDDDDDDDNDDDDDIVTDKQNDISDSQNDSMADTEKDLDDEVSSNKEEKVDIPSSQEETSTSTPTDSRTASKSGSTAVGSQNQYTDTYQNSEFRPYNPLSHTLEDRLFPRPFGPANFFDYPSWPDKTECLDVVENLSSWVKSSRMDIDMAKRGHE